MLVYSEIWAGFQAGTIIFFLEVQSGSGIQLASRSEGTEDSFRKCRWLLTFF